MNKSFGISKYSNIEFISCNDKDYKLYVSNLIQDNRRSFNFNDPINTLISSDLGYVLEDTVRNLLQKKYNISDKRILKCYHNFNEYHKNINYFEIDVVIYKEDNVTPDWFIEIKSGTKERSQGQAYRQLNRTVWIAANKWQNIKKAIIFIPLYNFFERHSNYNERYKIFNDLDVLATESFDPHKVVLIQLDGYEIFNKALELGIWTKGDVWDSVQDEILFNEGQKNNEIQQQDSNQFNIRRVTVFE